MIVYVKINDCNVDNDDENDENREYATMTKKKKILNRPEHLIVK